MNEPTINNMVQRLDHLERENRRLKRIGTLVVVGVAAVVLMGQAKPSKEAKVMEAEEIIIRDKNKQIRVSISSLGIHVLNAEEWTDPLGLDSLRKQVRMPGGKEKGSHHGREKKIYSNFQAAGSGRAVE